MSEQLVKVVLDMDPGVDDALAIMLAVNSPELEILGITTVSGNVHVDKTSVNALKILDLLGIDGVPVYKGATKPLVRDLETAEWVHGEDGLGDSGLPPPKRHPLLGAVRFLIDVLMSERGVTLITTGPLTNVALAFLLEPELPKKIERMIMMGGAFSMTPYGHGNATPVSEFNVYVDPEAASIVFQSGVNPLCVGLDVTTDPTTTLKTQDIQRLRSSSSPAAKTAVRIMKKFVDRFGFMQLHDLMAVAAAIDPTLFKTTNSHVYVVCENGITRGQTIVEKRSWVKVGPNAEICHHVDSERFLQMFYERLSAV
ncbi:MAG: nucleoside hydrolase [Candidatus Caldarchaeum sp.]